MSKLSRLQPMTPESSKDERAVAIDVPVRVLCRCELATGWGLAGLALVEVESVEEGARKLEAMIEDEVAEVILAEQALLDALSERTMSALERTLLPMVVPFPGPGWGPETRAPHEYVEDILGRALGYRVRLR